MLFAAYKTVSDIEILWSLVAAVGAGFSLFNLIAARKDLLYVLDLAIFNGRLKLARATFFAETTRFIKQLIFLAIGLMAMTLAEVPDNLELPWKQALIGFLIRWGLISASVLTTIQSYIAFKIRRELNA